MLASLSARSEQASASVTHTLDALCACLLVSLPLGVPLKHESGSLCSLRLGCRGTAGDSQGYRD